MLEVLHPAWLSTPRRFNQAYQEGDDLNRRKLLRKLLASPSNARFDEVCGLAEAFNFQLECVSGSHHIFSHPAIAELINLQEVGGEAKP